MVWRKKLFKINKGFIAFLRPLLEAISKIANCIIQLIFAINKDKSTKDGFLLKMNGPNESHDSDLKEASRVHFECKQFADVIIKAMKGFKNKGFIAFLRPLLNNENGFTGLLIVLIISFAIFNILSSAHIYTIRHSKYQAQIREASIMQVESENFAMMIRSAYENGTGSTTRDRICDSTDGLGYSCNASSVNSKIGKPNEYKCLISSAGKAYCMTNLIPNTTSTPTTVTSPVTTVTLSSTEKTDIETNCWNNGNPSAVPPVAHTGCTNEAYLDPACQTECQKHQDKSLDTTGANLYNECCMTASLKVINCSDHSSTDCTSYESSSLSPNEKMFCEICEMSGQSDVFTYTICPMEGTVITSTSKDDKLYDCTVNPDENGAFYQTFRILNN